MQSVRFVFRTICPPLIKTVRTICHPYGLSKANQSVQFVSVRFVHSPYDLSSVRFVCRPYCDDLNYDKGTKKSKRPQQNPPHFHYVSPLDGIIQLPGDSRHPLPWSANSIWGTATRWRGGKPAECCVAFICLFASDQLKGSRWILLCGFCP